MEHNTFSDFACVFDALRDTWAPQNALIGLLHYVGPAFPDMHNELHNYVYYSQNERRRKRKIKDFPPLQNFFCVYDALPPRSEAADAFRRLYEYYGPPAGPIYCDVLAGIEDRSASRAAVDPMQEIIESLYSGYACSNCMMRFESRELLARHLDMHYQNSREVKKGVVQHRQYFDSIENFITGGVFPVNKENKEPVEKPKEEPPTKRVKPSYIIADTHSERKKCDVCGEFVEWELNEEVDEWIYKDVLQAAEKLIHISCFYS